ncbi:MAG TPA: RibD family protein [Bellilinea sp.]|nr:RibD family protein [Bellilinea sp.]
MAMDTAERSAVDPADWITHQHSPHPDRPWVTLSYAQSLDGSIALGSGKPVALSSPESMRLTHRLRAAHDAILVGIGTVLADDPQLTVRLAPGADPQPVILDTSLRTPLTASLLSRKARLPWIMAAPDKISSHAQQLSQAGARLVPVPRGADGQLDLHQILRSLQCEGIQRVMVEGGARVIQSFLISGLVDWALITISPRWLGGLPALKFSQEGSPGLPQIVDPAYLLLGSDVVVFGRVA